MANVDREKIRGFLKEIEVESARKVWQALSSFLWGDSSFSWEDLDAAIFCFVSLLLVNETAWVAEKLFPLIILLGNGVIVLGVKKDEPGTWLVLVA